MLLPAWPALAALQEHTATVTPTTDPVSQWIVGLVILAVFTLLTLEAAHRVLVAMVATALLLGITYGSRFHLITFEGVREALDINVLVLLASMMAVVGVLKTTGVFEWAVGRIVRRSGGKPLVLLAFILVFTAIASAFLDNVTTVVFVTPMATAVAKHLRIPGAALLLPMVMASNIGGTATLIGDPPNIMIGSGAGLTFLDFMEDLTLPCAVMVLWLEWYSRRYYKDAFASATRAELTEGDVALTDPRLARWLGVICVLILLGFLTHHLTGMPPAVPALLGAAAALAVQDWLYMRRERPALHDRVHGILRVTEQDIEWPTLAFFGFLFIIVGAAVNTGLIATMAHGLQWAIQAGGSAMGLSPYGTLLFAALLICWVSGVMSALIDNIPFVAVAIPIIAGIIPALQGAGGEVLWWALSLGACLGGNGTPIGASANVTATGLAERAGIRITFREFARYAIPMTAGTLVIASLYLALHVYLGKVGSFVAMGVITTALLLLRLLAGRRTPVPS